MAYRLLPSIEYLRQCFEYDEVNGVLKWRYRPISHFNSEKAKNIINAKFAGKNAGCLTPDSYIIVRIDGQLFMAHRIIWALHYGEDPGDMQIDHSDLNRMNNKINNLRKATHGQNVVNSGARKHNALGVKGVYETTVNKTNRYVAQVTYGGKRVWQGYFSTIEEASAAYQKMSKIYHGQFAGKG